MTRSPHLIGASWSLVSYNKTSHLLPITSSVVYMNRLLEYENAHVLTADFVSNRDTSFPVSQSHNLAELSADPLRTRLESPEGTVKEHEKNC